MDIASSLVAFEAWDWNKKKQTPAQRALLNTGNATHYTARSRATNPL